MWWPVLLLPLRIVIVGVARIHGGRKQKDIDHTINPFFFLVRMYIPPVLYVLQP